MSDKNGSVLNEKYRAIVMLTTKIGCSITPSRFNVRYSFLFSENEKYCSSARMIWSRKIIRTDSAA